MLIPMLAIATVLIGAWVLASLAKAWARTSQSKHQVRRPVISRQRFSLWSFVLLLFAPSSSVQSLSTVDAESHSVRSRRRHDEEFCNVS